MRDGNSTAKYGNNPVVDDSLLSRLMHADALREAGHTVVEAEDGHQRFRPSTPKSLTVWLPTW